MLYSEPLKTFAYSDHPIRVVEKDGQPWFVLRDVCGILGVKQPSRIAERLDDDEKGVSQIHTLGGIQEMIVINESGLYAAILRSDKLEARPFRKWITSEVMPSLRKYGVYEMPEHLRPPEAPPAPANDLEGLRDALRGMVRGEVIKVLGEVLSA